MKHARSSITRCAAMAAIAGAIAGATQPARAQAPNWPTRLLTLTVPFAAGGSSDVIGRIVADGISNNLRQPVVVENVAAAGGTAGTGRVAKSPPDGYHVVIGNVGTFAESQWLYKDLPYNVLTDFAPVGLLTDESLVVVVRKDFPADNLQQFISYAKANQARMQFASSGVGGSNHLACLLFNSTIGVETTHVPYRNVVQGMQDVMSGRVDYDCLSLPLAVPQIEAKTLKPIAVLSKERSKILPELPTADEQGLRGFAVPSWYALFLPAKTPRAIVQRLNQAAVATLDNPAVLERFKQIGGEVVAPERRSPEYLAQFLAAEVKKWEAPIKASGLSL